MDIEKSKAYIREHYTAGLLVYSKDRVTYLRNINESVKYLMGHYDNFSAKDSKTIAEMRAVHSRIIHAKTKIDEDSIHRESWTKAIYELIRDFNALEKQSNLYEAEINILSDVMSHYLEQAKPLTLTVKFSDNMKDKKIRVKI